MDELLADYPVILSVNEVANILGVTNKTVRNMIKERIIPSFKVGRLLRIPKQDLIDYINHSIGGTKHE